MIGLAAFVLISTVTQTGAGPPQVPLMVGSLGGNLTLTCPVQGDRAGLFFWYKMKVGYMIQTVAQGSYGKKPKLAEGFSNGRFTTSADVEYSLNISDVCKEDEGIYLCQSGSVYDIKMTNATILVVRESDTLQELMSVKQDPESETSQADTKVNLQCSLMFSHQADKSQCVGERQCPSVHWFRAGLVQSNASMIYTTNSSGADGRSCDYMLSEALDEATYYCAVVTCGKILFGRGTRVETRPQQLHLAIVIVVSLLCCVITIAVVIMTRNQKKSKVCRRSDGATYMNQSELHRADALASNFFEDEDEAGVNYAALNFSTRQWEKRSTQREQPQDNRNTCTS